MKNNYLIRLLILSIVSFFTPKLKSQNYDINGWGIKAGVSINVGTHFQRVGLMLQGYYFNTFIQGNTGVQAFYNFRTLGPKMQSWEIVPNIGGHFYWGQQDEVYYNPEFSTISIQSKSPWAIGYSYKYYWDTKGTTQPVGIITINLKNFIFATENDIFTGEGEDKYRTGAVTLQYHKENYSFFITSLMWTGGRNKTKQVKSSDYPSPFGYLDLRESTYGKISHGTLAIGAKYNFKYNQTAQVELGIDSEHVRHFLQNKVIHDMPMFPKRWNKAENPHYPMLRDNGLPYLYGKDEKVKKSVFYMQLGLNQPIFY